MTREEAIKALNEIKECPIALKAWYIVALEMAIKALSNEMKRNRRCDMTKEEKKNVLHCLKVMADEEVCEECDLYGTTGTDHCEFDCVKLAIEAIEAMQAE